ncbi:MAG: hypothetical protein IKL65_06400 [Bacilli bacterium]|nr:hypothetical protein [Bacilli bacterium]
MKKNKLHLIMFLIVVMFLCSISVSAFSAEIGPISQKGDDKALNNYDYLALKYYGSTAVFCTEFHRTTPAAKNQTCKVYNNWTNEVKAGVASIIQSVGAVDVSTGVSNNANYYYGELAINEFLCNSGVDTQYTCVTDTRTTEEILGEGSKYYGWYEAAIEAKKKYAVATLSFSSSKLTFTKSGDNYISNEITITKNSDADFSITSNLGTVIRNGNKFYVSIPASSVSAGTTANVTVGASISKTNYLAQNYSCGEYQSVTPNIVEPEKTTASATATGSISVNAPKAKLTINKVDGNNAHLSGATITVTGTKGYSKTFVTDGNPIVIENLEYDTYTITEVKAPEGYVIDRAKTITLNGNNLTGVITLTDSKNKVTISKVGVTGIEELPGASLEVQDSTGNTLYKWVSTEEPYVIEGLSVGKYYLIETIAPEGYVLNKEKVEFEITAETTTKTVKMTNKLNVVKISKINSTNKKLLPGATLQIEDEKGNVIKYCTDKKGNKNTACKWLSTEKAYEITGLPNGKYYLVETKAPEGYELSKEKIKFTVDGSKEVIEVKMINELEVEVPDTLSSKSALLLAIAMFDIALGIGIVTYVKKNKIEE